MNTINAVRAALATRIATVGASFTAYPHWPGKVEPPCAVVARRETRLQPTFDIPCELTLAVKVFVAFAEVSTAQTTLDDYLDATGSSSIVVAIYADPTLAGTVSWLRIVNVEEEQIVSYGGTDYLSADLIVEVG